MARGHGKTTDILLDEFDFTAIGSAVDIELESNIAKVTAFADTEETYVEGKTGFRITVSGLWSAASPNYDGEIFTDLTSEARRLGIYPNGATAGERGYEGDTNVGRDTIPIEIAGVIALNVTWEGDTPILRSQVLYQNTAAGASGNGTAYQTGAVLASQTVVGILRLLAAPGGSGNNTLDVIVQSDNAEGFPSPATVLTFAQLNQASVALHEVVTAAGAITDDWWRVNLTYAGAGTRTFSLIIAIGIKPT